MSDIRFVGEDVHIEGNVQKVTCYDIELDNAGRRSNAAGNRRAFVHDFQDGLTLNWARDYPGGVTINGEVKIPNSAAVNALNGTALHCSHHTLLLDHPARRTAPPVVKSAAARKSKAPLIGTVVVPAGPLIGGIGGIGVVPLKAQRRALMHDTTDGLTLNVGGDYPGGVTIRGTVRTPETLLVKGQDLLKLVVDLQTQVAALEARVLALETAAG